MKTIFKKYSYASNCLSLQTLFVIQGVHELRQQMFWPLSKIQKIKTSIATHDLIG